MVNPLEKNQLGLPFVDQAEKRFFSWFQKIGLEEKDIRKNFYITQVIKCYLGNNQMPKAIEIKNLRPKIIIPIGILALKLLLGEKE